MGKKFEEHPIHIKITAVVLLLVCVAWLIYVAWTFGAHLYHHEWREAALQVVFVLLGGYWSANYKNKKKVKTLEIELAGLKASRKVDENASFMKGWQAGIDFQRRILLKWAMDRRANQG